MTNHSKKFFYLGILPALIFQFIGAIYYFFLYTDGQAVRTIYSITKIVILLWPVLWIVILKYTLPPINEKKDHKKSVQYGIYLSIVIALVVFGANTVLREVIETAAGNIITKVDSWGIAAYYIPFALFISFIHSGLEEYYWRWFVFRGLMAKFSYHTAAIIGSIAFMSHHVIVISQFFSPILTIIGSFFVFLLGYIWCIMYKKTGSIWGPWISHIVADAVILYVGYTLVF